MSDSACHLPLLLAAVALDALLGDPSYRWHPVRLLGHWILILEHPLFAAGLSTRAGGLLHWFGVVGGALACWWLARLAFAAVHPWLALAWDLYLAYSLLCLRDLLEHGGRVLALLPDLPAARRAVALLVGRDTAALDQDGVARAAIESLAENLTDGVLTPLWALALFGLPGLLVVKAISTLDSMVGHRNARYERFGWAGARSDDLIHWLPARLSVPLIALAAQLVRGHPRDSLRVAWRDHGLLASPNSGWSEAAYAGALHLRLVGPLTYHGVTRPYPWLGDPDWPSAPGAEGLRRALALTLVCCLLAVAVAVLFSAGGRAC